MTRKDSMTKGLHSIPTYSTARFEIFKLTGNCGRPYDDTIALDPLML